MVIMTCLGLFVKAEPDLTVPPTFGLNWYALEIPLMGDPMLSLFYPILA
jgi:hypothetical protein